MRCKNDVNKAATGKLDRFCKSFMRRINKSVIVLHVLRSKLIGYGRKTRENLNY